MRQTWFDNAVLRYNFLIELRENRILAGAGGGGDQEDERRNPRVRTGMDERED